LNTFSFLHAHRSNGTWVFAALAACAQLGKPHWTFWRENALITFPHTSSVLDRLDLNANSRVYHLDADNGLSEVYKLNSTDLNYRKNKIGQVHVLLQQLIFQRPINMKNVTNFKS
jgi:hypothetical protein